MTFFSPLLQNNDFEDNFVLNQLNRLFKNKRNTPFKMPKENTPVILLVSGGMDTIFLWYMLLKKYQLNVFPLHLKRHVFYDPQMQAVRYFSNYFKRAFPNNFHEPKYIKAPYSLFSFKKHGSSKVLDKHLILQNASINKKTGKGKVIMITNPARLGYYLFSAYDYSLFLKSKGTPVYTMFIGITPDDSAVSKESTLTVLRSINLTICSILGDWRYQISAPIEKHINFYYPKDWSLRIAEKNNLPIHKTWSCDNAFIFHCGICSSCKLRQLIFKETKIKDGTFYLISLRLRHILNKIRDRFLIKRSNQSESLINLNQNIDKKIKVGFIKISSSVITYFEERDGYLLDWRTGTFIKINKIGSLIVKYLEINNQMTFQSILKFTKKQYNEIKEEQLKKDILKFIKTLIKKGFITIT